MRCPRCEGELVTFSVEATGESAVVCESCGFAGVTASHRPERDEVESWDRAIKRFDETVVPAERTRVTDRSDAVTAPVGDSGPAIDPERLDESVSVAMSLRNGDSQSEDGE
jgi:hypothetical protein